MDKVSSNDHISSSMQLFPGRVSCCNFWLLQRERCLGSSSLRIGSILYIVLQIKIAAFHSTSQFSLAGIYQIFGLLSLAALKIKLITVKQIFKLDFDELWKKWSCGRKTSSTKSIRVQVSFQKSPTTGWAKLENCDVIFYWPPHPSSTLFGPQPLIWPSYTYYSWKIR